MVQILFSEAQQGSLWHYFATNRMVRMFNTRPYHIQIAMRSYSGAFNKLKNGTEKHK